VDSKFGLKKQLTTKLTRARKTYTIHPTQSGAAYLNKNPAFGVGLSDLLGGAFGETTP